MGDYREDSTSYGARLQLSRETEEKQPIPTTKGKPKTDTVTVPDTAIVAAPPPLSRLGQAGELSPSVARDSLHRLQRSHGNQYVRRLLQRSGDAGGEVTPEVERAIESSRGGGQPLDRGMQSRMGQALNADFSGVRVHTGQEADALNRSLSARAFTSGRDVYFRRGEYNPATSGGQELLAHELTHVVQQNGEKVQTKLSVGSPNDIYEQEADAMARAYRQREQQPGCGEGSCVRRQGTEEEEEKVQTKADLGGVQRQPEEEEEKVQTKADLGGVQRQPEEEEEKVQTKADLGGVQRQPEEEEEREKKT